MVLEPRLEQAQPVKRAAKRRRWQETAGKLGSRASKRWCLGTATAPAAVLRAELGWRMSFTGPVSPGKYF